MSAHGCGGHDNGCSCQAQEALADPLYETVTYPEVAFEDDRGAIINVMQGKLHHVAVITSAAGSVRANHWHPAGNTQYMYLVSGRYRVVSVPLSPEGREIGERQEFIVEARGLTETGPLIGHAYEFLEDSVFLNLNTRPRVADAYGKHTYPLDEILIPYPDSDPREGA